MAKIKNRSISFPVRFEAIQDLDGVQTSTSRSGIATFTRTRNGNGCPNFAEKIANGENATTSMTGVFDDGYHKRASGEIVSIYKFAPPHTYKKIIQKADVSYLPNYLVQVRAPRDTVSDPAPAISAAAAEFYGKLRKTQVILASLTVLGELPETLRMIRRPGEAFYKGSKDFLGALFRERKRDPKSWMKAASGLWLEHSFGWTPLINDAKDAAKALRAMTKERPAKVSAGAQRTYDVTSQLPAGDNLTISDLLSTKWINSSTCSDRFTVRYRAGLRAQAEVPQFMANRATFGFKPEEFVPTLWELLPWSFLADYFTNLGDMIEANATDTSRVAWISRAVIAETFYKGSSNCDIAESGFTPKANFVTGGSVSPSSFYLHRKRITRSSDVTLPIVTFHLETGLSLGQKLNILALLGQANELHRQDFRWRRG